MNERKTLNNTLAVGEGRRKIIAAITQNQMNETVSSLSKKLIRTMEPPFDCWSLRNVEHHIAELLDVGILKLLGTQLCTMKYYNEQKAKALEEKIEETQEELKQSNKLNIKLED